MFRGRRAVQWLGWRNAGRAALLLLSLWLATSAAEGERLQQFDMNAQPLSQALIAFSVQCDLTVLAAPELLRGRTAPRVQGTMTSSQALEALLRSSGLGTHWDGNRTVSIVRLAPSPAPTDSGR